MDGESCVKKAYEFILNSDFEQAIYWFEQAIAAEPLNAGYQHICAVSCARSGKWTKAHQYAKQAVELDGNHPEYQYHLQTIESRLLVAAAEQKLAEEPSQYTDAIPLLQQAADLDPLSFEAFYLLALTYSEMGRLEESAINAREAIRLDPGHSAARRLFADVNRKRRMLRKRVMGKQQQKE
ncbi:tetratricopeptide repeat protein [Paenibacillus sp. JDR-2]|uniref:tetratricopeptide repeat protein n=1 Tax=Paenibacillus sp. (strain JDR-2) TaxID=324057 RepID=UPI00016676EF|nr:tetratricopeptide repeat protein [Paenibacillus sp. JDR-2]ACT01093.1 Tetratricopeptide TPR_2 repeat protein [Paenibacillus sp. JDR-2]